MFGTVEWRDTGTGLRPFNADGTPHSDGKAWRKTDGTVAQTERDHAIARMSALRSAAIFAAARSTVDEAVKAEHVLKLADKWLGWIEQKGGPGAR